jgi:hypothetical protein
VKGKYFPTDVKYGKIWCIWGSNSTTSFPGYEDIFEAEYKSGEEIICKNVP